MKLYKTRIQKLTQADGQVKYFAQYKKLFLWIFPIWYNFHEWYGEDDPCRIYRMAIKKQLYYEGYGKSEKTAKKLIDCYVAYVNEYNSEKKNSKIVKTEYEDYP